MLLPSEYCIITTEEAELILLEISKDNPKRICWANIAKVENQQLRKFYEKLTEFILNNEN